MQKWTVFIVLAVLMSSCADWKKSEQLERLDAMETQLQKWESTLGNYDAEKWEAISEEVNQKVGQLKKLESDTIPLSEAKHLDAYREHQSRIRDLQNLHEESTKSIAKVSKRLKKLRSDIEAGNGKRHKYDDYLREEEQHLRTLEENVFVVFEEVREMLQKELPEVQDNIDRIIAERIPEASVQ